MAALASNGNGSTEKVEAAMENMSVNEPAKGELETVIGIDLGTTFSCVAVWDEAAGRPMVLTNSTGAKTMPSYVSFTDQARVVGQPAKSQAASNPANTVYDVKRIIGRSWNDQVVRNDAKSFPFRVVDGGNGRPKVEVSWLGAKKQMAPEEVSAMVLVELKRVAEKALGKACTAAVITVPAHFNDQQRQATKDAGRIAGLDVRRIINEPTAAALAYGLHGKKDTTDSGISGSNVVIFDLGGGTFDVSVLSMEGGVFEVKATGGDTHLGGEDFDNNMVDWAVAEFEKIHGAGRANKLKSNARAIRRLRTACENAKRSVSSAPTTTLEVESLLDDADLSIELSREKFESLNDELFTRCINTVTTVLKDASLTIGDVTDVVLVGGSTRVPALQDRLKALFGGRIELCRSINPDEAVAVGAAVQGHILAAGDARTGGADLAGTTDLLLLDVTPLSLGIELEGREMSVLIKRNTTIPCRKSRSYTTVEDWQTSIDVIVYEGERRSVDSCNKLGEFTITGVERARKGEPKVEVTFALDANGILAVTAQDTVTGAKAGAEIKAKDGRLSADEIDKMVQDAEKHRAQDDELADKMTMQTALEGAVYSALSAARTKGDADQVAALENVRDWLDYDSTNATLTEMTAKADFLRNNLGVAVNAD
ncbi:HSP70 [Ectocarpus sp. CCAP 1310/34]|nr:HSP70 [Ectocarpus sp. CCAP 1310/34]